MTTPMIRISQTDDLDLIDEMDRVCFPQDARLGEDLVESTWWVARLNGKPIGYAGMLLQSEERKPGDGLYKAYLNRAGVLPEARGGGLQKRLIRARCAHAAKSGSLRAYTYVWAANIGSMNSLISCGFRPYFFERQQTVTGATASFIYFQKQLPLRLIPLDLKQAA